MIFCISFFFSCQKSHSLIRKFLLYFYTTREEQLHFIIPNFNIFVIHGSNCASVTTDRDLPRSHMRSICPLSLSQAIGMSILHLHVNFTTLLTRATQSSSSGRAAKTHCLSLHVKRKTMWN